MSDQLTLSNTGTRAPRALQVAALPQKLRLCAMRGGLVWSNSASRARNRLRIESDQLRLQGRNGASSTLRVTFIIYRCPAVRRALSFRAIPQATSILLRERPPAASLPVSQPRLQSALELAAAHNRLVVGSSPTSSTTHSRETVDFHFCGNASIAELLEFECRCFDKVSWSDIAAGHTQCQRARWPPAMGG